MSTHSLGVMCGLCKAVLIPDDCCDGHGSTYQEFSEWAAKTWPEHVCFMSEGADRE